MLVGLLDICNRFGCGNSLEVLFLWEDTYGECTEGTVHFLFVSRHAFFVLLEGKWSSQYVLGNKLERLLKAYPFALKTVF